MFSTKRTFLIFVLMYSLQASAFETSSASNIIMLEAISYRALTEFNVHTMHKDKESEQRLSDVLVQGDELSDSLKADSAKLPPAWSKFRNYMWSNHYQQDGDIEPHVFNDMRLFHRQLLELIDDMKIQLNVDLLPPKDLYRINALLLAEQIASEYLEVSAATFGAFDFAGSHEAIQIEKRTEAMDRVINELNKFYSDQPEKVKQVRKLALKWKFIKGTLLAYNERSAPYAVARTVSYIREQLLAL